MTQTKSNYLNASNFSIATAIEDEIVNDPPAVYQQRMIALEHSATDFEEERFIRNSIFKKQIPKLYGYRCCVSGMKLEAGFSVQMVDACHIMLAQRYHFEWDFTSAKPASRFRPRTHNNHC